MQAQCERVSVDLHERFGKDIHKCTHSIVGRGELDSRQEQVVAHICPVLAWDGRCRSQVGGEGDLARPRDVTGLRA